jgi:uncharacterized membrane protein
MSWRRRFRIRESVRGSLWVIPLLGAVLGGLLGVLVSALDKYVDLPGFWRYSPSTASTLLTAIVGASAALTGFVVTVTVLVVQMATGTFSARYMRLWYRDRMLKATLAVLIGTLTFSFALLRRIEETFVPELGVTLAGTLITTSLLVFVFFFDRFIHRLRPVTVAALVAQAGRRAFQDALRLADRADIRWEPHVGATEPAVRVHADRAGSIQAFDPDGVVAWAHAHGALVVVNRVVGDFVPTGTPVMEVYGPVGDPTVAERELLEMIALGEERTIQQDPAFAIRIMVDIAVRALSPAVNDPTTAVQVLDHLGETLRLIGSTNLEKRAEPSDEATAAVVMRTRRWEDFLTLGVTEIREYGATSIQVMRRLRALLEELEQTVRPEHRPAVERELGRLDAVVEERWSRSIDVDRARVADRQGIGGPQVPDQRIPVESASEGG